MKRNDAAFLAAQKQSRGAVALQRELILPDVAHGRPRVCRLGDSSPRSSSDGPLGTMTNHKEMDNKYL